MDANTFRASASTVIAAQAETLYAFIADMPSMGAISPECTGGSWEGDARGVGALFVGSNAKADLAWQSRMRVVEVDPPRAFAWENIGRPDLAISDDLKANARWRYTFTPVDGGTLVEESWQYLGDLAGDATREERIRQRQATNEAGIAVTLANLKRLIET